MNKKILVLQIENRNDEFLNLLINENKNICNNNNIEYIFKLTGNNNVPPYWDKVFEIKKIMDSRNDIEYIYWLDSDAFLINFDINKINSFLHTNDKYSILIAEDMPPWTSKFNAGAFIIKNNVKGKEIINEWLSYYNSKNWNYDAENNKWKTDSEWAGKDYEQGSFVINILNNAKYVNDIKKYSYEILNNNSCTDNIENTISVHLADYKKNKEIKQQCLKKIKIF